MKLAIHGQEIRLHAKIGQTSGSMRALQYFLNVKLVVSVKDLILLRLNHN